MRTNNAPSGRPKWWFASSLVVVLLVSLVVIPFVSSSLVVPAAVAQTACPNGLDNDQCYNTQIISTYNGADESASASFTVTTLAQFTASNDYFTYQLNALVNQCPSVSSNCSGSWWMQGVVGIERGAVIGGGYLATGYYVDSALIEFWWGSKGVENICSPTITPYYNINQAGYQVYESMTINPSNPNAPPLALNLQINDNGVNLYKTSATCSIPSGATVVSNFYEVEGVIVGGSSPWSDQNFRPLGTNLFSATLTLESTVNDLARTPQPVLTQTQETSNLYQTFNSATNSQVGKMYEEVVQSTESTESDVGVFDIVLLPQGNTTDVNLVLQCTPSPSNDCSYPYNAQASVVVTLSWNKNPLAPTQTFDFWSTSLAGSMSGTSITISGSQATIDGSGTIYAVFNNGGGGGGGGGGKCGSHWIICT